MGPAGERKRGRSFRFTTGRLCLDLVATLMDRGSEPVELLASPADFDRWLEAARLLQRAPSVSLQHLDQARSLREAINGAAVAVAGGRRPAGRDVQRINAAAAIPGAPQLDSATLALKWKARGPVAGAISRIARDAVELLSSSDARIKLCARSECGLPFVDTTRASTKRWCSMASCGNRFKVARYAKSHRTHGSGSDSRSQRGRGKS